MLKWFYEVLWICLASLLGLVGRLSKKQRAQLIRSNFSAQFLAQLKSEKGQRNLNALFFCSSAGEYEQAKPLAQRLQAMHQASIVYVMGSASGVRFAKAQGEKNTYVLAPWDRVSQWEKLYEAFQPSFTVIVRYELWPGFLTVAKRFGPVYLVDAVQSASLSSSFWAQKLWIRLLAYISHIFVVGSEDVAFYKSYLARSGSDLSLVGDTKYDRVLERIAERAEKREQMREALSNFCEARRILLVGSAWPEDLAAILSVYPEMVKKAQNLAMIVAPHDVSDSMALRMQGMLEAQGLSVCRSSRVGFRAAKSTDDVLLFDEIGVLPELYSLAHVAWVGGGMHHRVHNVLEPACWGLYLCFGPRYQTSQEARLLVKKGLAHVVTDGSSFQTWFEELSFSESPPHQALWNAIKEESGASDRILQKIFIDLSEISKHAKKVNSVDGL